MLKTLLVSLVLVRYFVPSDDLDLAKFYLAAKQPDTGVSCCGEADAYYADQFDITQDGQYVAIVTDDRVIPNRPEIPVGTRVIIPNEKLNKVPVNPTGHGIVFLGYGRIVYCYFSPLQS